MKRLTAHYSITVGSFLFFSIAVQLVHMTIYLAADHRGFNLKDQIKEHLSSQGREVVDVGASVLNTDDDYVDFASEAAKKIAENSSENRGIFLCGSGHGVDIVANKFKGIRAALCWNAEVAKQSREHEDANVLILPADWVNFDQAKEIVDVWLKTEFSGEERHVRRLKKIEEIESLNFK